MTAAAAATEDKDRVDTCSTPFIFCVHGMLYVIIMTMARLFFVKRGAVLKMHPTSFSPFVVGCCLHASVASAMSAVDTALLLLQQEQLQPAETTTTEEEKKDIQEKLRLETVFFSEEESGQTKNLREYCFPA